MTDTDAPPIPAPTRTPVSGNVVVISIVVLLTLVMGAAFYAVANGRDAAQIIPLATMFLGPTIGVLVNLYKTDRQSSDLNVIRKNTNGALSRMEDRLAELELPPEPPAETFHYHNYPEPPTPVNPPTRWDMSAPQDYDFGYGTYPSPQPWRQAPEPPRERVDRPLRDRVRPEPQFRPGSHRKPESRTDRRP